MILENFENGKKVYEWNYKNNILKAETLTEAIDVLEKAKKEYLAFFVAKPTKNKEKSYIQTLKSLSMASAKNNKNREVLRCIYNDGKEFAATNGCILFIMNHTEEDAPVGKNTR